MADIQANIGIGVDTSAALAGLRALQKEISAFQTSMARGSAINAANADSIRRNLINNINATGQFNAQMRTITSTTESFTNALQRNKLSMGEYFRYSMGASKTFSRFFRSEFETINKVARERVKDLQTQYVKMGRDANGAMRAIAVRPLALDMENLATKTAMAAQRQQLFNQLLKQGSTNLLNFGKNTQWAGRQLMVGFTVPLTYLGVAAGRTFMKMEEQVIRFKRVYGELFTTQAETDAMVEQIRRLAEEFTKYGVAVEKTMEMAADAAAMGKMGAELTAQVSNATRLAVLGAVEQGEALETTISITNAFGIAAEDLAKKIDFLNAVENQTVVSIEDLTVAIPKAGPVVKQLGGDVEDLAFFLTAMKEGGINASEGANALKSGLASLINPTDKASKMLENLGINIKAIVEGNAGDIKNTVIGFSQALDTLDPLNRARAIEQLFGKFQFARLSTLFQNVVKEGTQAERVLKLSRATTEELAILSERELKRLEDSPMYQFKKAIEDIKVELVPLGKAFLEAVTPIVKFGRDVLEQFNGLEEGTKKFLVALTGIGGVIAPVFLMGFGLVANGVANLIKLFTAVGRIFQKAGTNSQVLGQSIDYMTREQLEAAAVAASLDQVHGKLTQTFTSEAAAVNNLRRAYQMAFAAQKNFMDSGAIAAANTRLGAAGVGMRGPRKYNRGVLSVPGPKGAGDIVPALLSPGEAVIPAKEAERNRTLIQAMISGNVPKFFGGTASVAKAFLGMPKSFKRVTKEREAADQLFDLFKQSSFARQAPEQYGHQIAATRGHSFPIFGVGGIYAKPDGSRVFVKPVVDERSALAELRGTQIAREVHGLITPQQRIVVMKDPTDLSGKRKFLALESPLDPRLATPTDSFTKKDYIKQLVASTLRGDKDLARDNLYGNVLADVGPAGVFTRASGVRQYAKADEMNSMAQQALINLLGVKGGAKKAFAEATAPIARKMTPDEFDALMKAEIREALPKLRKTVQGFGLGGEEAIVYKNMIRRLEDGLAVNWRELHAVHTRVGMPKTKVREYNSGVLSVPGRRGAGDVVPAMVAPGEAIIPADVAKENRGFIAAMIAGKIPGFNEGTVSVPAAYQARGNEKYAAVSTNVQNLVAKGYAQQVQDMLRAAEARGFSVVQAQQLLRNMNASPNPGSWSKSALRVFADPGMRNPGDIIRGIKQATGVGRIDRMQPQFAHIGAGSTIVIDGKEVKVTSRLGMDGIAGNINRQLARGGANVAEFLQNYNSLGSAKWHRSVKDGGIDPSKVKGLTALDREVKRIIEKSGATKIFDLQASARTPGSIGMDAVYAQARANLMGRYPQLFTALDTAHVTGRDYRKGRSSAKFLPRRFASAAREALSRQALAEQNLAPARTGTVTSRTGSKVPANAKVVGGAPTDRRAVAVSPNETIMTAKTTSAVRRGFTAKIPGLGIIGRVDGQPTGQGTERVRITQGGQYRDRITGKRISAADAKRLMRLDRQNERRRFRAQQARDLQSRRASGITQAYGMSAAQFDKLSKDEQSKLRAQRKQAANEEKRMRVANTQARIADEKKIIEEKRKLTEKEEKRQARKDKMKGMGGKLAGGVGGAAMVGVMGASMMGGKVGEVAQQLLFPAMMLPMLMPMLTNPIGAAAIAIGGLAVAAFALNEQFKKNVKESYKLATSTGASSEALRSFSEMSGQVTAGEIMDRRRATGADPFRIVEGKRAFGDSFLESEAGKAIYDGFAENVKRFGQDAAAQKLFNQLSVAVASGALSPEQARSIVQSLGEQINNYDLAIKVNSQLLNLYGPNGENLLENPLEVRIKIVQDSRDMLLPENLLGPGFTQLRVPGMVEAASMIGPGAARSPLASILLGNRLLPGNIGPATVNARNGIAPTGDLGFSLNAEGIGSFIGLSSIALQTQQEMLDSLQLDYEQRIATAKAQGDIAEQTRLESEYAEARNALMLENSKTVDVIRNTFADINNKSAVLNQMSDTIKEMFADDKLVSSMLPGLLKQIDEIDNDEKEVVLKAALLSGDLSPATLANILSSENSEKQIDLIINLGASGAVQANRLAQLFGDKTIESTIPASGRFGSADSMERRATPSSASSAFLNQVSGMAPGDALEYMDQFAMVEQVFTELGSEALSNAMTFYFQNPEQLQEYKSELAELQELASGDEDITVEVVNKVLGDDVLKLSKEAQAYFDSLPNDQKVKYTMAYVMTFDVQSSGDFTGAARAHATGAGASEFKRRFGRSYNEWVSSGLQSVADAYANQLFREYAPWLFTQTSPTPPKTDPGTGTQTGGSKPSNPFGFLLEGLKQLRKSTIKLKDDANATLSSLANLFGGDKIMKGFNGMSQQMRSLGLSQPIIDFILGMSPEEWDKWKDKLFKFDSKGNITGLKQNIENIQSAFNAITIGEFQDGLQQAIATTNNQFTAVNMLIGQGFTLAEAYDIVQDSALAAAIAGGEISKNDYKKTIDQYREANKQLREFAAISQVVADTNVFAENEALERMLRGGGFTQMEVQAIMSDEGLQEMIRAGNYSAEAFATRLAQILGSTEFLQGVFDSGFSRAMDAFAIMEEELRIAFDEENSPFTDAIEQAQEDISDLTYKLDDYQAGLDKIALQEEEINEKYEERFNALDKVQKVNEALSRTQKSQLSIADAISRGDVAAAAQAIQEYRAEEARRQLELRRSQLETQQQQEIASLTVMVNGLKMTRAEIEEKIRETEQEIFNIEEDRLEPNQRALELAERAFADRVSELEVLGKTRDEWANIKNEIDLARINAEDYVRAVNAAILAVPQLQQDYADEFVGIVDENPTFFPPVNDTPAVQQPEPEKNDEEQNGGNTGNNNNNNNNNNNSNNNNNNNNNNNAPTPEPEPTKPDYGAVGRAGYYPGEVVKKNRMIYTWDPKGFWTAKENKKPTRDAGYSKTWTFNDATQSWGATTVQVPRRDPKPGYIWSWETVSDKWIEVKIPPSLVQGPGGGGTPYMPYGVPDIEPFAAGGFVSGPGTPTSDSIPAMLSDGEYVVKASSVRSLGIDFLDFLNKTGKLPKFARGGLLIPGKTTKPKATTPKNTWTYYDPKTATTSKSKVATPKVKPAPAKPSINTALMADKKLTSKIIATKPPTEKEKRDALYKAGGFQGFEAGFQGLMQDVGKIPIVKAIGDAFAADNLGGKALRATVGALSVPVEVMGSIANTAINVADMVSKGQIAEAAANSIMALPKAVYEGFTNPFAGVIDPSKQKNSMFEKAAQSAIKNNFFGAQDNPEMAALARIIGGTLNVAGDPLSYVGLGVATRALDTAAAISLASRTLKNPRVSITAPQEALGPIANSRFKSQFEVEPDRAAANARRAEVEKAMGYHPEATDVTDRPIYGAIENKLNLPLKVLEKLPGMTGKVARITDPRTNDSKWFGGAYPSIAHLDARNVKGSFSIGDSFKPIMSNIFELNRPGFGGVMDRLKASAGLVRGLRKTPKDVHYIEAQMKPDVEFWSGHSPLMNNVKRVDVPIGGNELFWLSRVASNLPVGTIPSSVSLIKAMKSKRMQQIVDSRNAGWYKTIKDSWSLSGVNDIRFPRMQNAREEFDEAIKRYDPFDSSFMSSEFVKKLEENSFLRSVKNKFNPKKYFNTGGLAIGTDTIPAMLTPGEFVVSKYGVESFGVDNLKAINSGQTAAGSVYNYEVNVNVKSDANPDQIANAVMGRIRQVESQRIRGSRI